MAKERKRSGPREATSAEDARDGLQAAMGQPGAQEEMFQRVIAPKIEYIRRIVAIELERIQREVGDIQEKITTMAESLFSPKRISMELEHCLQLEMRVSELNLSVRSRKVMIRSGITTIGQLIAHTADDLLEAKQFGLTSLAEVREKLAGIGLRLRNDPTS